MVDRPRKVCSAKVDAAGRLKLPADLQRYLTSIGSQKVFITTLDKEIGRIYPIPAWNEVQDTLYNDTEDPDAAEDVLYVARTMGDDAEIDNQGRLGLPAALRKLLNFDNTQVWIEPYRGHLRIFSQEIHEARDKRASQNPVEKAKRFDRRIP